MKKILKSLLVIFCVAMLLIPEAAAIVPYQTYTYDIDGNFVESPHAYVPDMSVSSVKMKLSLALDGATDMVCDSNENIFIADPKNGRIVVLNSDYTFNTEIRKFVNENGVPCTFNAPQGVFVKDKELFICDTENNRIVVFEIDYEEKTVKSLKFDRIVYQPESTAFPEGSIYKPIACSVDTAGRIYVVSATTNYGIISMNAVGEFLGFLGAQKTSPSAWQIFWRTFQTKEQKKSLSSLVPTEYNNITIDESGFIYVTTSSLDQAKMASAISSKSTSGDYAPVKKLNAEGTDVMMRTGFFPPSGEITVGIGMSMFDHEAKTGVSVITDVALGPASIWTIVDTSRQKFFTYDSRGKLLFAFGDNGVQVGNNTNVASICYQGDKFLSLDKTSNEITVYKTTEYGKNLLAAVQNVEDRNYDQSSKFWQEVILRNSNFDEAYVGIGDALYRAGNYEEAQEYFKAAYDANDYSKCYAKIRKAWIEKFIILIPIAIVIICVALSQFFKYAAKVNLAGQVAKEKRTLKETLLYACHIIFHPFDGFWDLKHEKRGDLRAGGIFVLLTILAFTYNDLGKSFWYDPYGGNVSITSEIIGILLPILLWAVANWCLTTLFEGEGSFKDIILASCYSLVPIPLLMIPATILTNILTLDESAIITVLVVFSYVWTGFLLLISTMVTHDYSFGKNILTVLGTIIGMAFIIFILVLFSGLIMKVWSFIENLILEISLRFE